MCWEGKYGTLEAMIHIFIINPVAGEGRTKKGLLCRIQKAADEMGICYQIHITKKRGDAEQICRECCSQKREQNETFRFYAVGGDGTLGEVINGIAGCDFAQAAVIPAGTGNDFVRNFYRQEKRKENPFLDIPSQIRGRTGKIDVIRFGDRYAVNMINIGADCSVVAQAERMRGFPLMGRGLAYAMGILKAAAGPLGVFLCLDTDQGERFQGTWLLAAIGNGGYCGGGFRGIPDADPGDGQMNVSLVKMTVRLRFLSLLPNYKKGTYRQSALGKKIAVYGKCRRVRLCPKTPVLASVDGELQWIGETIFEILPGAVSFSFPEKADFIPE